MSDHNIPRLWKQFKQMLPSGHAALREAPNIERLLEQINDIDLASMDTRCGLQKDLTTRSVARAIEFDVDNFREAMDKLQAQLWILESLIKSTQNRSSLNR